ncbi:MAG: hypothetical protein WA003_02025 [Desulfuromonadaceae bacterium]
MNCGFHEDAKRVVLSYLRRTGQGVFFINGVFILDKGKVNIKVLESAYLGRAIRIADDGSIMICNVNIPSGWDIARIRRRIEDHLRTSSSPGQIINIATCLDVKLR